MQKKTSVCFILCFFVVFATTATGRAQLETGRAGPDLPGTATGRAEKNGPVQASTDN